jgi:hypothetical protein
MSSGSHCEHNLNSLILIAESLNLNSTSRFFILEMNISYLKYPASEAFWIKDIKQPLINTFDRDKLSDHKFIHINQKNAFK